MQTKLTIEAAYRALNEVLPNTIEFPDFSIKVDTGGASIYRREEFYLQSINPVFDLIGRALSPKCIIDVGANIGFSAVLLGKRFPEAQLIAIEPDWNLTGILKENLQKNLLQKVNILNMAAGDRSMENISFQRNILMSVDNRMGGLDKNYEKLNITQITLDDIACQYIDKIEDTAFFIKIDTQGYEEQVLSGSLSLCKKAHDVCILMEFAPFWLANIGTDPAKFLLFLCRDFIICEMPETRFQKLTLDAIKKNSINDSEVDQFVNYVQGLRREGKGWCDLILFRRP